MSTLLAIAAGGAIGAMARYLLTIQIGHLLGLGFPYGTMIINILGSMFLGALIEGMALFWTVGNDFRAFLVVGILGSFTTFSTFSLDVMVMFDRGDVLPASLYVLASVGLALIAFMGGMAAVRLAF
ncbi:MAG: fluoride efflux transporter CrcB [Alphaproteobacteria bacterium]|jgi:CrcB protein